ncbi:zinc ABC transporter substrate-binding protein [Spirochaetia bacterium]|nr:zinc ABC transporter substrate-binding protein [Spirochaetia bacterium]
MVVSILPQSFFTDRIAGDRVRTSVLVGPGQNPHNYEPSPRQIADLAETRLWILSGTEFEISLRPKIEALFPALLIVDGAEGVIFRALEEHDHAEEDGDHKTEAVPDFNYDRHTWLGAEPAKIMAGHIRDALCALDSEGAALFETNYNGLIADIDGLFAALRAELAPLRGRTVFVYHPSFGYFLDEFGLVQEAVETGGKEPTPRALGDLIAQAKAEGAAAVFVQAQFPVQTARTVADAVGAAIVPLDPLAADWLDNIRVMGDALKRALAPGAAFGEAGE